MEKIIKVKFVDFGVNNFRETHILAILRERYDVVITDEPEYLFYSVFSDDHLKYKDCVRIFVTTENLAPDYNLCDYSMDYEWLEYADRHLRFPIYGFRPYSSMYDKCLSKHINVEEAALPEKSEFCSFVYSNPDADPFRTKLFLAIDSYKRVNSGGRYMNNVGIPQGVPDKYEFQIKHKFAIACENSAHPGYTTEKLVEAFAAKTVPIYWGDPWVKEVFNGKSFICVSDFESLDACVAYIQKVDSDDELYISMLKEPAVIKEEYTAQGVENRLREFLYHIFDQEIEKAYRRNRVFWGEMYFYKLQRWRKAFNIVTLRLNTRWMKKMRAFVLEHLKK